MKSEQRVSERGQGKEKIREDEPWSICSLEQEKTEGGVLLSGGESTRLCNMS
jgi:hypothetical protein